MKTTGFLRLWFITTTIMHIMACQKPPKASLAIDPWASYAPLPMGSKIYNDNLKSELKVFNELIKKDSSLTKNDQDWLWAKHLFSRRRFIESSILLSSILKEKPSFNEARNYLARCLFFLGNPFKAVDELKIILNNNPKEEEKLDALYLMGAFIFELDYASNELLNEAILSWQTYLKQRGIKESLKKEVDLGLKQLIAKRNNEKKPEDENAQKLLEIARGYIQQGFVKKSLSAFYKLTKEYPKYAPGFHYQGMAFMMNGDHKRAVDSWKKAIKIDPIYAKSFNLENRIKIANALPNKIESH